MNPELPRRRHHSGIPSSSRADPGFWSGGQWSFDPREGALSPKFAQNRGFPLKIAWKLHGFEEILGAGGPGSAGEKQCRKVQIPGYLSKGHVAWATDLVLFKYCFCLVLLLSQCIFAKNHKFALVHGDTVRKSENAGTVLKPRNRDRVALSFVRNILAMLAEVFARQFEIVPIRETSLRLPRRETTRLVYLMATWEHHYLSNIRSEMLLNPKELVEAQHALQGNN